MWWRSAQLRNFENGRQSWWGSTNISLRHRKISLYMVLVWKPKHFSILTKIIEVLDHNFRDRISSGKLLLLLLLFFCKVSDFIPKRSPASRRTEQNILKFKTEHNRIITNRTFTATVNYHVITRYCPVIPYQTVSSLLYCDPGMKSIKSEEEVNANECGVVYRLNWSWKKKVIYNILNFKYQLRWDFIVYWTYTIYIFGNLNFFRHLNKLSTLLKEKMLSSIWIHDWKIYCLYLRVKYWTNVIG